MTSITTPDEIVELLRNVLDDVLQDDDAREAREALLLVGVERLPPAAYDQILQIERDATNLGYPTLV